MIQKPKLKLEHWTVQHRLCSNQVISKNLIKGSKKICLISFIKCTWKKLRNQFNKSKGKIYYNFKRREKFNKAITLDQLTNKK